MIHGIVPDEMVTAISSFVDVCYLAQRSDITESTLKLFDTSLARFYDQREVFRTLGVRPEGFSLPCQHALSHYRHMIQEFGAPNGICLSITKLRHITAVKKPWQNSNRYEALGQMLLANQRLDKLAAARADFTDRSMLDPVRPSAPVSLVAPTPHGPPNVGEGTDKNSEQGEDDPHSAPTARLTSQQVVEGNVVLARMRGELHFHLSVHPLNLRFTSSKLPALGSTCSRPYYPPL